MKIRIELDIEVREVEGQRIADADEVREALVGELAGLDYADDVIAFEVTHAIITDVTSWDDNGDVEMTAELEHAKGEALRREQDFDGEPPCPDCGGGYDQNYIGPPSVRQSIPHAEWCQRTEVTS